MLDPAPDPLESAKAAFDFLREVPGLRKVAETNGGEYKGPCPVCGGTDRFVAWPTPRTGHPRAWCRQCHESPMNGVDFLMWRDNLDFPAVCRRLGVAVPKGRPVAWYDYRGSNGELLYQVVRYDPKRFVCRAPRVPRPRKEVDTDWTYKLEGVDRVLYRVPEIIASREAGAVVWLCEGEKDADRLVAAGEVATTNPHGAGSWRATYAELLRDRLVVAVPDADADGARWAAAVTASVAPVARRLKVVTLPAGCKDVSDYLDRHSMDELAQLAAAAPVVTASDTPIDTTDTPTDSAPPRFRVLDDGASDALAPPRWLVDDLLIAGAVNLIYGLGGSGKSVLAIDLACALAAGWETWRGRAAAPGPVVYIAAEAPEEVAQRKRAWKAARGVPTLPGFYLVPERVPLLDPGAVPALLASLPPEAAHPALFVVDTLARTMRGGDENSGQDMGRVFEAAEQLRDATGATILIIHHSGKDTSRGARGSSLLTFDARQALSVTKADNVVTVETEKHNNSGEQAPWRFVFRAVPDPADPAAQTVVLEEAADAALDAASGPLAPFARAVLDELCGPIFHGEATSAELERVDDLHGRGVHRALKTLLTRGLITTPHPPRTPGRRFRVTGSGWALLGRKGPIDSGLTRFDSPAAVSDRATDNGLTTLPDPTIDSPDPAPRHGLTVTDSGLTVTDSGLTTAPGPIDTTDNNPIGLSVVSIPDSGSDDDPDPVLEAIWDEAVNLLLAGLPAAPAAPIWASPPEDAPPRPTGCARGHHTLSQRWDIGPPAGWRCASCWNLHSE